jgi:putative oxidoreductase
MSEATAQSAAGRLALILGLAGRAMLAGLFLWSGLFGIALSFDAVADMIAAQGLPAPRLLAFGAGALEILGPIALFQRRAEPFAAAALSGYCVLTAVLFHPYWAVDPAQRFNEQVHFLKDLALAGGFLVMVAAALDRAARRD